MSQEIDRWLRENEPETYSKLVALRDRLVKEYPNLVPNAWLSSPYDTSDYILVITFTSLDPNNPVSECLVSNQYEDPEFCFDDLSPTIINGYMNAPLPTGSWIGE